MITNREACNLHEGDEFYIILYSNRYVLHNPFIRQGGGKSFTSYIKPLGVFKTKLLKIDKCTNRDDYQSIEGILDTSNYQDLIWKGRWDEFPDGKCEYDYVNSMCTGERLFSSYCKGSADRNNETCIFFNREEAIEYYNKKVKQFNKNIKTYISKLKSEVEYANKNIDEINKNIIKYESFL